MKIHFGKKAFSCFTRESKVASEEKPKFVRKEFFTKKYILYQLQILVTSISFPAEIVYPVNPGLPGS